MNRKFTEEEARLFERNLSRAQEFIEKSRKTKRLEIMKLRNIMNNRM